MKVVSMTIKKRVDGMYWVSADTKYTRNMLSNKLMTKQEIIDFLNSID
jgi:hypothetical protein